MSFIPLLCKYLLSLSEAAEEFLLTLYKRLPFSSEFRKKYFSTFRMLSYFIILPFGPS